MNLFFRLIALTSTIFFVSICSANGIQNSSNVEKSDGANTTIDPKKCANTAYPRGALRDELEGNTVLLLSIGESGKIESVKIEKSSGWRILDDAATNTMLGCQVTSETLKSKISKSYIFKWSIGNNSKPPALNLLMERCPAPSKIRFADPEESGLGIVVGKTDSNVTLEWGSGQSELDKESIEVVKSCKLLPPFSVRFFPKN